MVASLEDCMRLDDTGMMEVCPAVIGETQTPIVLSSEAEAIMCG